MHNFFRVLRIALRHRLTVIASVGCSLAIALLWGGNITAIYPIVDIVMAGKSIPQYVDEHIAETETQISELDESVARLRETLRAEGAGQSSVRLNLDYQTSEIEDKQTKLAQLKRWAPWAHQYLPNTAFETLTLVCLGLFLGTILKSIFRIAGAYCTTRLRHLTAFELRKQFYRRTMRLDLSTFGETSPGDLMNRFTGDVNLASNGTQEVFGTALRAPLMIVVCLAGAAWISWQLLLLTMISAPLSGYAIHWLAKALKRSNRKALEELSLVYDRLEETFGGLKVVKAFTSESRERSRFHQQSKQFYRKSMRIAFYDSLVSPLTEMMGIGMIVAAVVAGGYLVLNQQTHLLGIRISQDPLTHGWLTLFYGFLAGASDPIRRLSGIFNGLQKSLAASDHLYELFDRESEVVDPSVPVALPSPVGRIQFRDVSFYYKPEEPVLRGIDLTVKPGETIALIGPNGCGKSTLMNLLPRFYDPQQGSVSIEGVDVRNVRIRDLRARIGVVTQETLLFDDTLAENIRYGSPGATDEQVVAAAKRAHAHKFITEKLSDGYNTMVGSRGGRLSGGQRQRIALARAILRDPEILILDEATSQIDVESERLIHDVLEEFVQDRTAFMITHRPSTLSLANRIVVMEQGKIVNVGSFDELAAKCQLFRRLAHLNQRESA
ncbi:ABC transporter ATP-binding protein [Adhaeretor mobilis]|uniref:Putative ABC transporter ATP-binding protein n=1 Tax=Adhaeretor mobilis TaxID=1930276 RepID=A0A517MPN9_9BACT|nr:ABC transporter ATP-binding protein [Adhaeretor mobilis]QDS96832.1 putative ABC transporter ATP-binding protein [Adhaeretor mobilis]